VPVVRDIQAVSIAIASGGVFLAAIYYIFQIRHQTRMRQTDMIMRLYTFIASKEFLESWEKVRDREVKSVDDYKTRYGSLVETNQVSVVFAELGMLLQKKLIDIDLIDALTGRAIIAVYEKLEARALFNEVLKRERRNRESDSFEYLYNGMKEREQRGVVNG
jgi:hypothetical protein